MLPRSRAATSIYGAATCWSRRSQKRAQSRDSFICRAAIGTTSGRKRRVAGGREINRPVDLATMPLYVRAGAILPFGPLKQYTSEKVDGPLTLVVYPGVDAAFTLYEDDGETFNYRRGEWRKIQIAWNDVRRTLSLRLAKARARACGCRRYGATSKSASLLKKRRARSSLKGGQSRSNSELGPHRFQRAGCEIALSVEQEKVRRSDHENREEMVDHRFSRGVMPLGDSGNCRAERDLRKRNLRLVIIPSNLCLSPPSISTTSSGRRESRSTGR